MIRAFVKSKLSRGTRRAIRQVIAELKIQRRHSAAVAKARGLRSPMKIHLGCGPNLKPGWVNIDLVEPAADLALDLREPLPFPDGSATIIYSEHFFEHLDYPDHAKQLLREAYRVLASGGVLSLVVPDAAEPLMAYARGDREYSSKYWDPNYPAWLRIPMHRINYTFRQIDQHKYAYDEEILTQELREAGFRAVRRREFDAALDLERRIGGSLYVEGVKP